MTGRKDTVSDINEKYRFIVGLENAEHLLFGIIISLVIFIGIISFLMVVSTTVFQGNSEKVLELSLESLSSSYSSVLSMIFFLSVLLILKEIWIMEKRLYTAYKWRNIERSLELIKVYK